MGEKRTIDGLMGAMSDTGASIYPAGRILYIIHELSRLIAGNFDYAMTAHNLTHGQWWAMMHVFENPGVSQSELANIMQMTRASAGKLLERMEAKNWIERRPDASDSRLRRVYPADGAVPIFELMTKAGVGLFDQLLGDFSAEEEAALLAALRHLRANALGDRGKDRVASPAAEAE